MSVMHLLGSGADGGAETYFVDLVKALSRSGPGEAAAIRAHPARQQSLSAAGVAVRTFAFGNPLDLMTRRGIAAFARERQARVLVAWMNRAARHTPRGPWARIGRLGGYYKLRNYRGFEALVGNTRDIVDWMVREGWPAERAHYIPNFAEAPADVAPVSRASLDTPPGAPLLLSMGRLHAAKAHDVSLQALRAIPGAYLWIAGAGPLEDQLKTLAAALGLSDRVRFLGWRNDPSALYGAADLCLFPSRFEPLGNTVIQCWAHGLPVIAAASQGPAALIKDGDDGLLVPIDDAEALAGRANTLLADPMLRIRLIQNGHARVEAEFSQAAILAQWRALFAQYGAS